MIDLSFVNSQLLADCSFNNSSLQSQAGATADHAQWRADARCGSLNNVIFKKCTYSGLFLVKDYLTTCCFQWFSESLRE